MLAKLFPVKIYLHILQLEEYSIVRFYRWFSKNYSVRSLENKKPLVITQKVKTILILAFILYGLIGFFMVLLLGPSGVLLFLVLLTQFYLFLTLSLLFLKPYERINRVIVKKRLKKQIEIYKKKGLLVIGITGSYGKTSVKETLYQLLRKNYKVLRTPGSYNTLFGIKKVVELELDESYDFFICEMGAYTKGEIKELCETFLPDYGILIGINEQHLERFGNLANTIEAKFELPLYLENSILLNFDDDLVKTHSRKKLDAFISYGKNSDDCKIQNISLTPEGSTFTLKLENKSYSFESSLVGFSKISNMAGAIVLAKMLGMPLCEIQDSVKGLTAVAHRLDIKQLDNGALLLDDAYSSNIAGFYEALSVLALFHGKSKIIATPGIVELDTQEEEIHKRLGKKISEICDFVLLVGNSSRTNAMEAALTDTPYVYIDSVLDLWPTILSKYPKLSDCIVLIENDLPDNY